MDALVSTILFFRRGSRQAWPALVVVLIAMGIVLHAAMPLGSLGYGLLMTIAVAGLVASARQRASLVEQSWRLDLLVGCLMTVAAFGVIVHVDRALDGRCYPLVYLTTAIASVMLHRAASLSLVAMVIAFEALLSLLAFGGIQQQTLGPHALFLLAIALINMLSLRLEMMRLKQASKKQLQAERDRIREEARSYRLLRAPSHGAKAQDSQPGKRARDEERLLQSGVEQIEVTLLFALKLLRQCLHVHTAMVLWLDDKGQSLRIAELATSARDAEIMEGPFATGDGILGAVLSQERTVYVDNMRSDYLLPYYRNSSSIRTICAVPIFEHGGLRGVMIVDRCEPKPFTKPERQLVEQAAGFAARAIENERVFVQLERTKVEQGKLYRASERLSEAISEQEVVDAGVLAASEIAAVDFAAFVAYDSISDKHQIRSVRITDGLPNSLDAQSLEGKQFRANKGLVAMAVRNRHPLPYRGQYDSSHQVVFDRNLPVPDMPSLLVLPLYVREEALGSLVLGSRGERVFHEAARHLLEVLGTHLAVSLANARMVRKLEEQATTDGLTGLLNKRAMFDIAAEKIAGAKRFGRSLSVLIADIDHFKRVNDTYGHDVGDIVIKELADIHQRNKRSTDAVARFGGEEFVTICEETDAAGAMLLAERIRDELRSTVFHANGQEVRCTCSIGIATFPAAGSSWHELFKAADDALYVSKRGGRDQVTIWGNQGRGSAA
jgi:two-component system, cell cycle response regulator